MSIPEAYVYHPEFDLPGPEHFVRVPDDEYVADYVDCQSGMYGRLALWFRLRDDVGDERLIAGFYKVRNLSRGGFALKPGQRVRRPDFQIGFRARLARDLGALFPIDAEDLPTRIPLIDRPVLIKTRLVTKDQDGVKRAEGLQNSVVDRIVGWAS